MIWYKKWIMILCNIIHKGNKVNYKTFLCLTSTIWREQRDFLVCDFPIKFIHFLLLELHQLKLPTCFKNSTYFSTGIFVSFWGCFNKELVRTASCFIHAGMQTTELPAGSSDYLSAQNARVKYCVLIGQLWPDLIGYYN